MDLFSLILVLAKAYPAFARQVERAATELRRLRLAGTHHEIDAACDAAQAAPWECPAACPLRALRLHDTGAPSGTLPKAP